MGFYQENTATQAAGNQLVQLLQHEFQLTERDFSFTWLQLKENNVWGTSYHGEMPFYPASIVKLFYMVATFEWIKSRQLTMTPELQKALRAMIQDSSNDATSYIVDMLTDTTSGPEMKPQAFEIWLVRRRLIQEAFRHYRWPEFDRIVVTQKTWEDRPYGREHMSRLVPNNRNMLTTLAVSRLLLEIYQKNIVTPDSCEDMLELMYRPLENEPKNLVGSQRKGFLGEGLHRDCKLWSKAGWTSNCRHDAAIIQQGDNVTILTIFLNNAKAAENESILPKIARHVTANPI
jgi:hypothetical protein